MSRGDQLARQWQIIHAIASSRSGRTAAELADTLAVNLRTIYRDLEALQTAGFPLYTCRSNGKNYWSLLESVKGQIPIPFTFTELLALYFCSDLLTSLQDTVFFEALNSLFQKIRSTLPPESLQYLSTIQKTFTVGKKQYKTYGNLSTIITCATEAAMAHTTLQLVYYSMSRKQETERLVDPYHLWFYNGTFYMVGYCHTRGDIRIFALDRIKTIRPTQNTFVVPEDFDVDAMMQSGFGVAKGIPEHVQIFFDSSSAGYVQERVWHQTQKLFPQPDGSLVFEADIALTDELKMWVLSWGPSAKVLSPPQLVTALRNDVLKMAAQYTGISLPEEPSPTIPLS